MFLCSKILTDSLLPLIINEILIISSTYLSSPAFNKYLHIPVIHSTYKMPILFMPSWFSLSEMLYLLICGI